MVDVCVCVCVRPYVIVFIYEQMSGRDHKNLTTN